MKNISSVILAALFNEFTSGLKVSAKSFSIDANWQASQTILHSNGNPSRFNLRLKVCPIPTDMDDLLPSGSEEARCMVSVDEFPLSPDWAMFAITFPCPADISGEGMFLGSATATVDHLLKMFKKAVLTQNHNLFITRN